MLALYHLLSPYHDGMCQMGAKLSNWKGSSECDHGLQVRGISSQLAAWVKNCKLEYSFVSWETSYVDLKPFSLY